MPHSFLSDRAPKCPESLLTQAQTGDPVRVALARAGAPLPMQAAKEATDAGIMTPVLIGEADAITQEADALSWDIAGFEIIPTEGEEAAGLKAAEICGAGDADVLMKGHLHTDHFMRAALNRDAGLRTGNRLVHIFLMTTPESDRPLLISDAAVNVAPDLTTRQAGLVEMTRILHALGNTDPKLAILSATESAIPSVPSSMDAAELAEWAADNLSGATVAGPLAMDLILSKASAETKGFDSPVAGNADGISVPDIVSGNAIFKTLVYTAAACAAGIVMGAKVPILLTSRADPPAARLASIALAAVMSSRPEQ